MFVILASQWFGDCAGVAVHVHVLHFGAQMLSGFPICVFFFSVSFWVLWCQLESCSLPLQQTGKTQCVGIVLLSSNFLPRIQRFRWQASSILLQTYWCSRKKIQCFGYTDIWCWLANGSNLVQLVVLAQREQGQGGASSSDGNRDATFMLPKGDSSRSCIMFRIVGQLFHSLGGEGAAVSSVNILNFHLASRRKELV